MIINDRRQSFELEDVVKSQRENFPKGPADLEEILKGGEFMHQAGG